MATQQKFYLRDTTATVAPNAPGASSLTGVSPSVTAAGASTVRATSATPGGAQTSATLTTLGQTASQVNWFRRWATPPLAAQTISAGNWTVSGAASEGNAASNLLVFRGGLFRYRPSDGTTATIYNNTTTGGTEPGTSQTAISTAWAGAATTLLAGDVLVLEVWGQNTQGNGTARANAIFYDGTTEASTSSCAMFLNAPVALALQDIATASSGLNAGPAALAATASRTQPSSAASAPLAAARATLAGAGSIPTFGTGSAGLVIAAATLSAAAGAAYHPVGRLTQARFGLAGRRYKAFTAKQTTPPTYTGEATLTAAGATLSAPAILYFLHPVGELTQPLAGRPGRRYAAGAFASKGTSGFTAAAALVAPGAALSAAATAYGPTRSGAGDLTASAAVLAAAATASAPAGGFFFRTIRRRAS